MATSKSYYGIRRKSTKSHTYSQDAFGRQITKDRVLEIKNPRSESQMYQRMIVATATAAYKHLRQFIDGAFEGLPMGARTQQAFMKYNVAFLKRDADMTFNNFAGNPYQNPDIYPNNYMISVGSLPTPAFIDPSLANTAGMRIENIEQSRMVEGVPVYDHSLVSIHFNYGENGTFEDFCNVMGLENGDVIGIVIIAPTTEGINTQFVAVTIIDRTSANVRISSNGDFSIYSGSTAYTINLQEYTWLSRNGSGTFRQICEGAVLSRKVNGRWKKSTSFMSNYNWNHYTTDIFGPYKALETYPMGDQVMLNATTEDNNTRNRHAETNIIDCYLNGQALISDEMPTPGSQTITGHVQSDLSTLAAVIVNSPSIPIVGSKYTVAATGSISESAFTCSFQNSQANKSWLVIINSTEETEDKTALAVWPHYVSALTID